MNGGRLKEVIVIQRPTITKDEFGANRVEWKNIISTRSDVQFDNGSRAKENGEIVFNYTKVFTIRITILLMKKTEYYGTTRNGGYFLLNLIKTNRN